MRPETSDEWGIKDLQNCILNITKYIHEFCSDNQIEYCLMGGSALGAIRHQGFIPWDDDMDLFMTPNEYLKFRKCFNEKGDHSKYYLQELGESKGKVVYAKLRLNNSSFIEDAVADFDIHHGVYVDIMIQHHFPDGRFRRLWMVIWQSYLEVKSLANRKYLKRGRLFYYALRPLSWVPKRFLLDFALSQIWRYKDLDCNNYFHFYISQPLFRSIYPKDIFESYVTVNFETIQLNVPVGVRKYLEIMFGDYMKVPNTDTIKWHQHTHTWSSGISFEKRGKGIYEAERYLW